MKLGFTIHRAAAPAMLNLVVLVGLQPGCGSLDVQDFIADNACNIFNCQTLFFVDDLFASPHGDADDDHGDDMADMDGMDDPEAHEDEGDDHMDDLVDQAGGDDDTDEHDDDGDDTVEEEHDDATEGDIGS